MSFKPQAWASLGPLCPLLSSTPDGAISTRILGNVGGMIGILLFPPKSLFDLLAVDFSSNSPGPALKCGGDWVGAPVELDSYRGSAVTPYCLSEWWHLNIDLLQGDQNKGLTLWYNMLSCHQWHPALGLGH